MSKEKKAAEKYLNENFIIYRPQRSPLSKLVTFCCGFPKKATYYAHGNHENIKDRENATMEPIEGMNVKYLGPHGQDLGASVGTIYDEQGKAGGMGGPDNLIAANPGPNSQEGPWYNYELTPITERQNQKDLQDTANKHNVTVLMLKPGKTTDSRELLNALSTLGYANVTPIHCRGDKPVEETELYFPAIGRDPENPDGNEQELGQASDNSQDLETLSKAPKSSIDNGQNARNSQKSEKSNRSSKRGSISIA